MQSVKYLDGQWPDLADYVKHGHVEIDWRDTPLQMREEFASRTIRPEQTGADSDSKGGFGIDRNTSRL